MSIFDSEINPMPIFEKVEVTFVKKEYDTAVICLDSGRICRINQRYIYGVLGGLAQGDRVFVKKDFIADY